MSKSVAIPTAAEVNDAHQCAQECAGMAVEHAQRCGELLAKKKKSMGYGGGFDEWIKTHCKFSRATAYNYIKASAAKAAGIKYESIREALGTESRQPGYVPKSSTAVDDSAPQHAAPAPKPAPEAPPAARAPEPAAPQVVPPGEPEWTEADEVAANEAAEAEERERVAKAMAADDKLAEALEQIKQLTAENARLKARLGGEMNALNAARKTIASQERQITKLRAQIRSQAA